MKRVQVSLNDDEYEALRELSDLRGESMSLILGGEVAALRLFWQWKSEIKVLRAAAARDQRSADQLAERLVKIRSAPRGA